MLLEGRWDELQALLAAMDSLPNRTWLPALGAAAGVALARGQGDIARARALVREVLPGGATSTPGDTRFITILPLQELAAAVALDAGDLDEARSWLEAHDRWLTWGSAVRGQSEGQALWARYHWQAGDLTRAHERAERALAHAAEPRQPLALLAAHRLLGELDAEAGRFADAAAHLGAALALADACGAPYERALTLLALAELRAAQGRADDTRALLADVRGICEPLEAKPALARAVRIEAGLG